MKNTLNLRFAAFLASAFLAIIPAAARPLKAHGIFTDHMVLQREKPIVVWGWADEGEKVLVSLGEESAETTSVAGTGRWEVSFPARDANATPVKLVIKAGDESVELNDILIGDLWVMNGQSNMAFGLAKTLESDLESAQADLPLLRRFGIAPNEKPKPQEDLPAGAIEGSGWTVASPVSVLGFSAIGYNFGSRLQRTLQVPIGLIDNARGGASIESLVPAHKFVDDPLAKRYEQSVRKREAEFDPKAAVATMVEKWEKTVADQREKGVAEDKLPPKPTQGDIRSWGIPGASPSDAAACYNGMFGVFKGLNIKGVLFHQGFNNAMGESTRPERYRVLMKLMVEGWREDFNDPQLAVGVIGFCAGSIPQTRENFEVWSVSAGSFIRESQRLGLADAGNPERSGFLPAYDIQIPGLHPLRKQEHGIRAARWALNRIYGKRIDWNTASLVSAQARGDVMELTFDKPVMPESLSMAIEGFSIADESGNFYMGHAAFPLKQDAGIWNSAAKNGEATKVLVWSPLVKNPVAVRYGWAVSPMGNLKVNGKEWNPLPSFRTDEWDWPESEDPEEFALTKTAMKDLNADAVKRNDFRRNEEAKQAVEILARLRRLGMPD